MHQVSRVSVHAIVSCLSRMIVSGERLGYFTKQVMATIFLPTLLLLLLPLLLVPSRVHGQCQVCKDGGQCCSPTSCCIGGNFTTSVCCDDPTESCCQGV